MQSAAGINASNLLFEDVKTGLNGFFFKDADGNKYADAAAIEAAADPEKGIPIVYSLIQNAARQVESLRGCPAISVAPSDVDPATMSASGVSGFLSELSNFAGKPLVVFFDEVDCLCDATLIAFLRQLRDGARRRRWSSAILR